MAVDPNVYALSISLDFDASEAFSTLEKFAKAASDIEERISRAAQNTINSLTSIVDSLESGLTRTIGITDTLASSSERLEGILIRAADAVRDSYDLQSDNLEDLEERIKFLEEVEDIQGRLEQLLIDEQRTGHEYLGLIDRWIDALSSKNQIHDEEGQLLDAEHATLEGMQDALRSLISDFTENRDLLVEIRRSASQIFALIAEYDEATERFTEANYRAYGSQQEILNQTRRLSAEQGVFRDAAIETYKALADVKTPLYEIERLAATIGMANRVTGLGVDVLAEYSRMLRGVGFDADRTRKQIDLLAAAQRLLGLTTYDLQKAIEFNNLSVEEQVAYFGEDAPEAFMKASLGLRGIAKELGVSQKAADDWLRTLQLTGVEAAIVWEGFAGIAGDATIEEKFNAMGAASRNFVNELGITQRQMQGLDRITIGQQEQLARLTEKFGITTEQLFLMARAEAELSDEQKAQLMNFANLEQALENEINAEKRWNETLQTLTGQLASLKAGIAGVIGPFIQLGADALVPVLQYLNSLVTYVQSAIDRFGEWWMVMEQDEALGGLFRHLRTAIPLITMVGAAVITIGAAIASLWPVISATFSLIAGVVSALLSPWTLLIGAIIAVGAAIYYMIGGWEGVQDIIARAEPVWRGMLDILWTLGDLAKSVFSALYDFGVTAFQQLREAVDSVWPYIRDTIIGIWQEIVNFLGPLVDKLVEFWHENHEDILRIAMNVWQYGILPMLKLVGGIIAAQLTIIKHAIQILGPVLLWLADVVLDVASFIIAILSGDFGRAFDIFTGFWHNAFVAVGDILASILQGIIGFASEAISRILGFGFDVVASIFGFGPQMTEAGASIISDLLAGVRDRMASVASFMLSAGSNLIVNLFQGVRNVIEDASEAVVDAGARIPSKLLAGIKNTWSMVVDFFESAWRSIIDKFNPFARASPSMVDSFKAGFDKMRGIAGEVAGSIMESWSETYGRAIQGALQMKEVVDVVAQSMHRLSVMGDALAGSDPLGEFVQTLEASLGRLDGAMDRLSNAISEFYSLTEQFVAINVAAIESEMIDNINASGNALASYVDMLEEVVARINSLVFNEAIPAMRAAAEAGIDEAVRSEAIHTVQVVDRTEGEAERTDEHLLLVTEQVALLRTINERLEQGKEGAGELMTIVELLETYLPDMISRDKGLTTEFNQWMK